MLVVFWRLRYKLSLRDIAEMFLDRGFTFTHETVRNWEMRFAPLIAENLRKNRRGKTGPSWYVDETYVKVYGVQCYLYRAIDRDGNLIDVRLSASRDMASAKAFFKKALKQAGGKPDRVTTDGHNSFPRAIGEELGEDVTHRTNRYLNNRIEQDHRGIKQRYYPMRGFMDFASAARYCEAFEEVRQHFRATSKMKQKVSLKDRRQHHLQQLKILRQSMASAA
jgi:transposase-like protein